MSELDELKKEVSMLLDKQKETNELLRRLEGIFTAQNKPESDWIGEKEAAQMVGYSPKRFRAKVTAGEIDVAVTAQQPGTYVTNRQYSLKDLKRYLKDNSTAA